MTSDTHSSTQGISICSSSRNLRNLPSRFKKKKKLVCCSDEESDETQVRNSPIALSLSMAARAQRVARDGSLLHPKVVQFEEPEERRGGEKPSQEPYQALAVLGGIKEKGFGDGVSGKFGGVSLPRPSGRAFPVARHRSEGPHWAPSQKEQTIPMLEDYEELGAEALAGLAKPLQRKKKEGLQLSKWKINRASTIEEKVVKDTTDEASLQKTSSSRMEEQHTSAEDVKEKAFVSIQPPKTTFTLPSQNETEPLLGAGEVSGKQLQLVTALHDEGDGRNAAQFVEPVDYSEGSRLRSNLGASNSGQDSSTGMESALSSSGSELETIDAQNRAAVAAMSATEVAEAQVELMERLRPEVLDMLKRRGLKKGKKWHKEVKKSDELHPAGSTHVLPYQKPEDPEKETSAESYYLEKVSLSREEEQGTFERETFHLKRDESERETGVESAIEKGGTLNTKQEKETSSVQFKRDVVMKETLAPREEVILHIEEGAADLKSWTERVEAVRLYRFDLEGNLVGIDEPPIPSTPDIVPDTQPPTIQSIAERDYLRTEGDPAATGYTLKETADLVRSTVPGHRALALRLVASVLENAIVGLQGQGLHPPLLSREPLKDVDWQAVWAYALGPEPELALTLRLALDDTHATVVVACVKALHAFLSCSANEAVFDLREAFCPGNKQDFTAPVFRRHTKLDEGFIGGGRWKYNVKASELYPFIRTASSQEEDAEGKETVGDDATVASKDCAAGLIRMGLLPRIRYILEVEKLKAAEETLLGVVIALARHSPAAADCVMKCPRLMDSIIKRFLYTNEDLVAGVGFAHTKAIQLLKTLLQASRSNHVHFVECGALQAAQIELYKQGFPSQTQPRPDFKAVCSTLIESLRMWRSCIHYQEGISVFSDIYPSLCYWLSPLTIQDISSNKNDELLSLAQESYNLLETLAHNLPRLHSKEGGVSENDDEYSHLKWTWSVAIPLVETALGWLCSEQISALVEQIEVSDKDGKKSGESNSRIKLIGTLASVFHFLATVSEKILGCEDAEEEVCDEKTQTPFIPTFIPRLGLLLASDRFIQYKHTGSLDHGQTDKRTFTLLETLCLLRHKVDEETSLAATCCLHALVRLFNVIDQVIKTAKPRTGPVRATESGHAHKVLDSGLVESAKKDLRLLLDIAGAEVIGNRDLLQSSEVKGRGGPAPGLGLGWGSLGGGAWSKRALVAQATALLVTELLELLSLSSDRSGTVSGTEDSVGRKKSFTSELMWRINCGFGIAALARPADGDLLTRVYSNILFNANTLAALSRILENTVMSLEPVMGRLSLNQESLSKFVLENVSKVLRDHYTSTWMSKKKRKILKNAGDTNLKGILKGKYSGSRLATVREDNTARMRLTKPDKLVTEWARQRLPLPSHWLLSPMASNITQSLVRSEGGEGEVGVLSTVDEDEKAMMEKVVKSGLSWLLNLESLCYVTTEKKSSSFQSIPLARKVHALSSVFVLGGDVFLHEEVRASIGALQELYGPKLDISNVTTSALTSDAERNFCADMVSYHAQTLDFEQEIDGNYTSFAENLAEQFGAGSFGDLVFARQVAIHLRQGVPDPIRLALWRIVTDAQALRLLPPLSQCIGQPWGYLYPFERNDEVVGAYVSTWTSGALDTAAAQASVSFTLCLHHIFGFLFGGGEFVREALAIKKVARTLVRSSLRKSQQQHALERLLVYQPPSPTQNLPSETVPPVKKVLEKRVKVLLEACEGDRTLLSEVEHVNSLITTVH